DLGKELVDGRGARSPESDLLGKLSDASRPTLLREVVFEERQASLLGHVEGELRQEPVAGLGGDFFARAPQEPEEDLRRRRRDSLAIAPTAQRERENLRVS